ncbi:MAG: dockerin type I repeat-containing protein [Ruminococcus sp.]|nr:dockerin type I repeat-containing protein [Ruminococcus sp.]
MLKVINDTLRGETSVAGDVNADGSFNVSDLVLLQRWLLAAPDSELADWQAGDLCEDNRLDVFDLCLMRRMLVE